MTKFQNLKNYIKRKQLKPKLLDAIKWSYVDVYRRIKYRDSQVIRIKEHGVFIVEGRTGGGKTTMAVHIADLMIEKYGRENIYVVSNTEIEGQDFKVNHWGDLTLFYNKPMVFIYDECNSDWTQNSYKELDIRLRVALTQNRKGYSKMVLALTQDYGMLLNEWRRLAKKVYVCKTLFGRYTWAKKYDSEEYEELYNTTEIGKKMKIRKEGRLSVVQTDDFRKKYDSFGLVTSIKKPFKDYVVRKEILPFIDNKLTDLSEYVLEN
jgi:energy-coupling factor transporter ATP-binding protein EcfA2